MKLLRSSEFNMAASAVVAAGATGLAYAYLGFLGVALVGLGILFTSAQVEIGKETMQGLIAMERSTPAERRARRAESESLSGIWKPARPLGLALAAVGIAGFVLLQLPR